MQVKHPRAGEAPLPSVATVNGTDYAIEDGVIDAAERDARRLADAWADRFGCDPGELLVDEPAADDGAAITSADVEAIADEIIAEKISDGACPWCDGYTGENVGMHASRAHPEAWADYNED